MSPTNKSPRYKTPAKKSDFVISMLFKQTLDQNPARG
jgi:hypothetical protein